MGWLTVVIVIADDEFLNKAIVTELAPNVLVERVKVVLKLSGVHLVVGHEGRVQVHVWHQDGLRVRGLDMFAGAAVAVTAGSDLVVEAAVDLEKVLAWKWGERVTQSRELHTLSCSVPKMEAR